MEGAAFLVILKTGCWKKKDEKKEKVKYNKIDH